MSYLAIVLIVVLFENILIHQFLSFSLSVSLSLSVSVEFCIYVWFHFEVVAIYAEHIN